MEEIKKCPLCGYDRPQSWGLHPLNDTYRIQCRRCGQYIATWEFLRYFKEEKIAEVGYLLSGLARELNEGGKELELTTKNAEALARSYPVPEPDKLEEKANKFLQNLRAKTKYFGEDVPFKDPEFAYPLAYARNSFEFKALLKLLKEKKLIEFTLTNVPEGRQYLNATLLVDGWDLASGLAKSNKDSNQGFVAVWFDDSMNESILAIEEGIREAGYNPVCIRDIYFPERIMDKALAEIRKSRFVVVDLTGNRSSIFFEAGFAHGLGIEAIYIYKEGGEKEKSPLEFYVKHYQCHKYSQPSEVKEIVKNAINARIKK